MDNIEDFDFLINDDDEAMLLLYSRNTQPQNPLIEFNATQKSALLKRDSQNTIKLEPLEDEICSYLASNDKLLICELSYENNDDDTKINYAYEASIKVE